jgi:membrane protein
MPEPQTSNGPDPAWRRQARLLYAFGQLLVGRFVAHRGLQNAAALTYTTLLSLVPLMTVVLAVFSAFPVAERVSQLIQDFLFANFVPASGEVLRQHLLQFSAKASQLTGTGFAFLIVVALLLMRSIDRTLNVIWDVRRRRGPVSQFLVYWAVLSLGPLLIGASVVATSYLVSLPLISEAAASGIGRRLFGLTPVLASTLAFTLIYALVPNRRVSLRHALAGGVLAALLFEAAKRGFGWYLTNFPTYEAIYGALATIPIFLVWLYLSWIVVLLGAEFTHCLGIFRRQDGAVAARRLELADAVRVLTLLGAAHGQARSLRQLAAAEPRWSEHGLEDLLNDLHQLGLLHRTDGGDWVLARDTEQLTLAELLLTPRFRLPAEGAADWPEDAELAEVLRRARGGLQEQLQVPLRRFQRPPADTVALSRKRA